MTRVLSQHRTFLGKSLKFYGLLIVVFAMFSIIYLMWIKPSKISTGKNNQGKLKLLHNNFKQSKENTRSNSAIEGDIIIHLDLKGAPPKIIYYEKLFPLLKTLGATGILIEYEDMFPYTGALLGNISAYNAYSVDDIATINQLAKQSKLKVIPLVQTFGHMEFILKLQEFIDYREVPAYPQVICPSHSKTLIMLQDMLEQVLRLHPDSDTIHIGADEVYYLGICDKCTNVMWQLNLSRNLFFLEHIKRVIALVRQKYPSVKILLWDDEFRSINKREFLKSGITTDIQPVVWKYTKDVYDELGPSLWNTYATIFPKVWIASTFKGATGSNQFTSDVTHYVQNHRSWLSVVNEYKNRINFQGIIVTGWQRYDHFAILCELLPVSIPALAMSLRVILGYQDSPLSPPLAVANLLDCEQPYALIGSVFGTPKCSYPGADILENVLHLQQIKQEFDLILEDSRSKGWIHEYNIEHSFSSPELVESVTLPLFRIRGELQQIDVHLTKALQEVYDLYTVSEWKETYLKPFRDRVEAMWNAKENLISKTVWPRRPLKPSAEL